MISFSAQVKYKLQMVGYTVRNEDSENDQTAEWNVILNVSEKGRY